ncbi:hypothetical protein AAG906_025806 [Vitis piasezkii]
MAEAMKLEIESMYSNSRELVDLPEGIKPIGCKWIYKRKRGPNGKVETFKARLVAKGFTQKEGVDYEDTFSPVAMLKSIRILLSITTYYDYEIWQMDRLFIWSNQKVSWSKTKSRKCANYKEGDKVVFLVLYVDDILLIGNDVESLSKVKNWLASQFQMKDLGEASYILGIQMTRDRKNRPALSQQHTLTRCLSSLQWRTLRKGICLLDMEFISLKSNHILKYLRRTRNYMLVYSGRELIPIGYTDSDFQSDRDSRSLLGRFTLGGGAIIWRSVKQTCVADSTMEAEYVAACEAAKEALWQFLKELKLFQICMSQSTLL